jgi:predicted naringenin-chalcone synthase
MFTTFPKSSQKLPTIAALEFAVPTLSYSQDELFEQTFKHLYRDIPSAERIFRNSGVKKRHISRDLRSLCEHGSLPTGDRMKLWKESAMELGRRSVGTALKQFERHYQIGSFVMASCTGYDTPSPDILLAKEFGLSACLRRTFIGHMGCYAAFNTIKVALDSLMARPHEAVMINCTETCSLHMRPEATAEQAVCHSLFGDASAAAILVMDDSEIGPKVLGTHTETYYETSSEMGWTVLNDGFRMWLTSEVPRTLAHEVNGFVDRLLEPIGIDRSQIQHWGIHPGGPKIIELVGRSLGLSQPQMRASRAVLENYGNCSSPTILMVLRDLLTQDKPQPGSYGVMLAFGPGLTMEGMAIRF